jgi:hypothetical protein
MGERGRQRAEHELLEGQRLLESGDVHGALAQLERARKDFLKVEELGRLRDLRAVVENGYREATEADEPAFERLLYATAQNVRFLSRRRAKQAGAPWEDPHPELEQPGRPEMRAERGMTRRDRRWIVLAGVLGAAVLAAVVIGIFAVYRSQRVVIINDTAAPVQVALCGDRTCDKATFVVTLAPGNRYTAIGRNFRVTRLDGTTVGCLHGHGVTRRVSSAGPCGASGPGGATVASASSRRGRSRR